MAPSNSHKHSMTRANLEAKRHGNKYMLYITNRTHGSVLSPEYAPDRHTADARKAALARVGLSVKIFLITGDGGVIDADARHEAHRA